MPLIIENLLTQIDFSYEIFQFSVDEENELDRYAIGNADNASAETTGDAQSVRCVEWQQAITVEHEHCQAAQVDNGHRSFFFLFCSSQLTLLIVFK